MTNDLIHREQSTAPTVALALALLAVALVLVEVAADFPLNGWGILAAPFLLIVAATIWSLARYHSIRLTPSRLVVGRATYAPHDFDLEFGVRTEDALTDEERSLVESPMPIPGDAGVQLAGGGFGRHFGAGVLVLLLAGSGKKLAVASRHTDRLGPLLGDWLVQEPDGGS